MKRLLIILTLTLFTLVGEGFAHPADNRCLPGENELIDSCISPHKHLGLNNNTYYACWKGYQHERRHLDKLQRHTLSTRDQVNQYVYLNNLIAAQCEKKRCKKKWAYRQVLDFGKGVVCTHKGKPQQECVTLDLLTAYWDVIPMEILSRKPGDLLFCQGQLGAAKSSVSLSEAVLWHAQQKLAEEHGEYFRRANISPK